MAVGIFGIPGLYDSKLHAQRPGCDGQRFREHVFSDVDSTIDVLYGSNFSHSGFPIDLRMDIYEPAGDTLAQRPLIVVVHGGSYISGDRKQVRPICLDYASRGYVAAAINYRLYYNLATPLDTIGLFDVVMKSVGDLKAAIRYLRQTVDSGNVYGINPDWVFSSGVSSGAISAMIATYLTDTSLVPHHIQMLIDSNGGLEGNTLNNYQYSSEVNGVIGYSGAIRDTSWIAPSTSIPAFCVHDDLDEIVPYGRAEISTAGLTVELMGSLAITEKLSDLDVYNDLITFEESGSHVSYFTDTSSSDYEFVLEQTASFLNTIYCPDHSDTITVQPSGVEPVPAMASHLRLFPNPAQSEVTLLLDDAGAHRLQVFSMQGGLISELTFFGSSHVLHTALWPNGVYFVHVISPEGRTARARLVVQH